MNKQRRKEISAVITKLENIKEELENILGDEQDYYDNIPENLQMSERADQSSEAIDIMEDAISSIEDITDQLEEVI